MTRRLCAGVVTHESKHEATVRQPWVTTERFRQAVPPKALPTNGTFGLPKRKGSDAEAGQLWGTFVLVQRAPRSGRVHSCDAVRSDR